MDENMRFSELLLIPNNNYPYTFILLNERFRQLSLPDNCHYHYTL